MPRKRELIPKRKNMYTGTFKLVTIDSTAEVKEGEVDIKEGKITKFPTWWELLSQERTILQATVIFTMPNSNPLLIQVKNEKLLIEEALARVKIPGIANILVSDGQVTRVECDLSLVTMKATPYWPLTGSECSFTLLSNDKIGEIPIKTEGWNLVVDDAKALESLFRLATGEERYIPKYIPMFIGSDIALWNVDIDETFLFWDTFQGQDTEWTPEAREDRIEDVSRWLIEANQNSMGKATESSIAMEAELRLLYELTDEIIWISNDNNQVVSPKREPEISDKIASTLFSKEENDVEQTT